MNVTKGRIVYYTDRQGAEHAAFVEYVEDVEMATIRLTYHRPGQSILDHGDWSSMAETIWVAGVPYRETSEPHSWRWPPRSP